MIKNLSPEAPKTRDHPPPNGGIWTLKTIFNDLPIVRPLQEAMINSLAHRYIICQGVR